MSCNDEGFMAQRLPRDAQRDFSKQAVQYKMALQAISVPSFAGNVVESRLHCEKHNSNEVCPRATSVECTPRRATRGPLSFQAMAHLWTHDVFESPASRGRGLAFLSQ